MRAVATSARSLRLPTADRPASRRSAGISALSPLPHRRTAQPRVAAPDRGDVVQALVVLVVQGLVVPVLAQPAAVAEAAGAAQTSRVCPPTCPRRDTCRPTFAGAEMVAAAAPAPVAV